MDVRGIAISGSMNRGHSLGLWVELNARGWCVTICATNVAAAVSKGSNLDDVARRRIEAEDLSGGRDRPLLPRRISCGLASLSTTSEKMVVAVRVRLDHDATERSIVVGESVLKLDHMVGVADVSKMISQAGTPDSAQMRLLWQLSNKLHDKRKKGGALAMLDDETGWRTVEDGSLVRPASPGGDVGIMITREMEILANSSMASFCVENDIIVPFLTQPEPPNPIDRLSVMEGVHTGVRASQDASRRARRAYSLQLAETSYSPTPSTHHSLNIDAYMHSTSPLSRYVDLVAQRQILCYLRGKRMEYSPSEIAGVCDAANSVINERRKVNRQSGVEKMILTGGDGSTGGALGHLSQKSFSAALEAAIKSAAVNQLMDKACAARVLGGRIALIDIYRIISSRTGRWPLVREVIPGYLALNPSKAISIAAIARQIGGWSAPVYDTQRGGSGGGVIHTTSAHILKPGIQTGKWRAGNLKLSKQMAIAEALAIFMKVDLPKMTESEKSLIRILSEYESDPVGTLELYCREAGDASPVYDIVTEDDAGRVIASCAAGNFKVVSPPESSRKNAHRSAAGAMVKLLIHLEATSG